MKIVQSFLFLLFGCCLMLACKSDSNPVIGHWQGHGGDGTYLELIAHPDSVYLYDSYRKKMPKFLFPKGSFAYEQVADSFLVFHAEQERPGVIRLPNDQTLTIGSEQSKITFQLISRQAPIAPKSVATTEGHQFRLEMIKREAQYICQKHKLSKGEEQMLVKQLTDEENGYYAWLQAQK